MEVVWYLDRAAAMVAYPSLYVAVLTGVLYNARAFGPVQTAAQRVHVEVSTFATVTTLLHGALGALDAWLVVTGQVPAPAYSMGYFLSGVLVGAGALALLVVAVLGFLDAKRFDRPWGPRVVHAFAYGAFAFGTLHAVAIGTDVVGLIRPVVGGTTAFVLYVLALRFLVDRGIVSTPGPAGQ